jgi:glycosyltransferase involved in cell wall biosynthesis
MNNTPILSILIPTRNREEYALKVITHILEIKDERFEVVIYNNSDSNQLADLLKFNKDSRLKYFYNGSVLSFVDNFSLGIEECKGEFISIIGDDDGINPVMLEVVDWAIQNRIDAITPSLQLVYYWPGSGVNSESGNGRLTISGISGKAKISNPKQEVIRL